MPDKQDSMLKTASQIQKQYRDGLSYKKEMGFLKDWPTYERFKAGDQWPAPTNKTKNLPRPVFNIIKQIEDHKVASVMNENIKMVYSAMDVKDENDPSIDAADSFTKYSETTWENIKQDVLNEEALESASNTGTGIWHYYWDSSIVSGNTVKYIGDIKGETIDPVNFFPGNPQNRTIQGQPYIIITSREELGNVKAEAIANGVSKEIVSLIKSDKDTTDQGYDMAQKELSNSDKVTVITKYWKDEIDVIVKNGDQQITKKENRVMFTKVASGVVIKPKTDTGLRLYPLAVMQWERRKRSIFGVGDTEGLIPNQNMINFLIAMQMLSAQLTGWPKILVDKSRVKQNVSNDPGEIVNIIGDGHALGSAMEYMSPAQMPSHIPNLVETVMSYTKEVAGANENALGEQNSAQLNATAIIALQKQAGMSIESIKRRFYQAMEDVGRIWEEFWKTKYITTRQVMVKNDQRQSVPMSFKGSDYKDLETRLKIDIGPASTYSESLMMTSLDKLFDSGHITLEQYLEFAPKNVIPFKDRLLKQIQAQQNQQHGVDIQSLLQQLTPQEQKAFLQATPQIQSQIISELQAQSGGQQQAPPVQQQQPNTPQQAPPPAQPQPMG